jgi:GNAT superfamily N-acetyltransferase
MIEIQPFWTSEIDADLEGEIMQCFSNTFSQVKNPDYFRWKFRDNPFGDSLHIVSRDRGKVIGSRVFWRLDVDGIEAYQCVDTSTLPEYQGRGLFKRSAETALDIVGDKIIYNYPNALSGPAYIKAGWREVEKSRLIKVNFTSFMCRSAPMLNWSEGEIRWRFENNPEMEYFIMREGDFYFVFSVRKGKLFVLLFKTRVHLSLKTVRPMICFSYDVESKGVICASKLPYMSRSSEEYSFNTYLFDMA